MSPRTALIIVTAACAVGATLLFARRQSLQAELATLTAAHRAADSAVADAKLTAEVDRIRLSLEQARAQPARNADAHLALALGDGHLTLERGEIVLRAATVNADVPRGIHTIANVGDKVIELSGGIRLVPESAADTSVAPPLTIRVSRLDFGAIRPNVRVGLMAYFF